MHNWRNAFNDTEIGKKARSCNPFKPVFSEYFDPYAFLR
jgi:hypothetical protein